MCSIVACIRHRVFHPPLPGPVEASALQHANRRHIRLLPKVSLRPLHHQLPRNPACVSLKGSSCAPLLPICTPHFILNAFFQKRTPSIVHLRRSPPYLCLPLHIELSLLRPDMPLSPSGVRKKPHADPDDGLPIPKPHTSFVEGFSDVAQVTWPGAQYGAGSSRQPRRAPYSVLPHGEECVIITLSERRQATHRSSCSRNFASGATDSQQSHLTN